MSDLNLSSYRNFHDQSLWRFSVYISRKLLALMILKTFIKIISQDKKVGYSIMYCSKLHDWWSTQS